MLSNFWQDYKAFYAKPFTSDMSVTGYFLFIGLVLVIAILWSAILATIIGTIKREA